MMKRFGWLMAAAAAMCVSSAASAEDWRRFQFFAYGPWEAPTNKFPSGIGQVYALVQFDLDNPVFMAPPTPERQLSFLALLDQIGIYVLGSSYAVEPKAPSINFSSDLSLGASFMFDPLADDGSYDATGYFQYTSSSSGATFFNASGQIYRVTVERADPLPNPGYTAYFFPPVPEPETWAMFIVGFGAVGATLRRRRAAVSFA